jgi:small subunit ribosomal protein S4
MTPLKFKLCRTVGENVKYTRKTTSKQKTLLKFVLKKNTNRKSSDYSKKLLQMKKLAFFYGLQSIKNHRSSTLRASNFLDKKKSLLLNLETRLDVILVRLNFCPSLFTARQLIAHKKICINFHIVNLPGLCLRAGDLVSVTRPFMKTMKMNIMDNFKFNQFLHQSPNHLEANYKTQQAILLYEPTQIHFPYKINLDLIF